MDARLLVKTALLCGAFSLAPAWADTPAPTAASKAASAQGMELGQVQVKGTAATVEVLREMKNAIKAPFDNDPTHYDDMVCVIKDDDGFRAQGKLLECGTQGWFGMERRRRTFGDLLGNKTPVPTLGHPWHVERLLDYDQLAALRELLKTLPAPGEGDVQVVDDTPAGSPPGK